VPEPDSTPRLTTFTLTDRERNVVARCLTMAAALMDALEDSAEDVKMIMDLWERVAPETLA
jgi:truncated hemoglobin YjbI